MSVGYSGGERGIWQAPTSAHFHICFASSIPSGVSISLTDRKVSSSWWLRRNTPWTLWKLIGAATSHSSRGGGQYLLGNKEYRHWHHRKLCHHWRLTRRPGACLWYVVLWAPSQSLSCPDRQAPMTQNDWLSITVGTCWRRLYPEQPGPGVRLCDTAGVLVQIGEGAGISVLPVVRLCLGNHQTTGTRCRRFPVGKVVPIKKKEAKFRSLLIPWDWNEWFMAVLARNLVEPQK